jgi:hypothetical protein
MVKKRVGKSSESRKKGSGRQAVLAKSVGLSLRAIDQKHRALILTPDGKLKLCAVNPDPPHAIDLNDCIDA